MQLFFILSFICSLVANYSFAATQTTCAFCAPEILERQAFYEDDLVMALYSHKPIMPGHCLIIPKRHVERFEGLTDEEMTQIGRVIKKVQQATVSVFHTSSYLLLQKNGREVGQTVPHVHVHMIPRVSGNGSILQFFLRMYYAQLKGPIADQEMVITVKKLREALAEQEQQPACQALQAGGAM